MFLGQLFERLNLPLRRFGVALLLHLARRDDVHLVEQVGQFGHPLVARVVHPVGHGVRDDVDAARGERARQDVHHQRRYFVQLLRDVGRLGLITVQVWSAQEGIVPVVYEDSEEILIFCFDVFLF